MSNIINTRSPFHLTVSNASLAYATLDIEIYSGEKTIDAIGVPTYSFRKQTIANLTSATFEISEIVKDYLDLTYDTEENSIWVDTVLKGFDTSDVELTSISNTYLAFNSYEYFEEVDFDFSNNSLMMSVQDIYIPENGNYKIPFYTENNPEIALLDNQGVELDLIALSSSNESGEQVHYLQLYPELLTNVSLNDSSNWSIRPNDIIEDGVLKCNGLGSRNETSFAKVTGNTYRVEFTISNYVEGQIAFFDGSAGQNISGFISSNGTYYYEFVQSATSSNVFSFYSSTTFVGHIEDITLKEVLKVSSISVDTDAGEKYVINIHEQCEPKYSPNKVTFINKFGVQQDLYFFKKSVEKMMTKKESYKSYNISNGNFSRTEHTSRDYNITSNESISLSSGFVPEDYNEVFKQLLLSEKVWITNEDNLTYPVNIKTSDISYKTNLNDKLIEYTMEFEKSYNTINSIR